MYPESSSICDVWVQLYTLL